MCVGVYNLLIKGGGGEEGGGGGGGDPAISAIDPSAVGTDTVEA